MPPHAEMIGPHPRIQHPSIKLKLRQHGNKTGQPPPRKVRKLGPNWLIDDFAGASGASARRELRVWTTVRSHCIRERDSLIRRSEIVYNANNPGTKTDITRSDTAPQGVKPLPHWRLFTISWGSCSQHKATFFARHRVRASPVGIAPRGVITTLTG